MAVALTPHASGHLPGGDPLQLFQCDMAILPREEQGRKLVPVTAVQLSELLVPLRPDDLGVTLQHAIPRPALNGVPDAGLRFLILCHVLTPTGDVDQSCPRPL